MMAATFYDSDSCILANQRERIVAINKYAF
jgi:hypothetical protein